MAKYSSAYSTRVLETSYHSNARSEWRLPSNEVYSSDLRVAGLGLVLAAGTAPYNVASGAMAIVSSMALYDGNVLLESIENASSVAALKHMRKHNDAQSSMLRNAAKSSLGFFADDRNQERASGIGQSKDHGDATNDEGTTAKALIRLKDHFGILDEKRNLTVSSKLFKNLRLVIQYRSAADLKNSLGGDHSAMNAPSVRQPQLLADVLAEELAEQLPKEGAIVYDVIESERLNIPETAADTDKSTKYRSNAFTGKYVEAIALQNDAAALKTQADANIYKTDGSLGMRNEVIQVAVNGENIISYDGISSSARKSAYLVDAWGDMCLPYGADKYNVNAINDITVAGKARELAGKMSWGGCAIRSRVSDLQIDYKRKGKAGGPDPTFDIRLYGKVRRAIEFKNDVYRVVYA